MPVFSQEVPLLMQGSPYDVERKKLLVAGWQKVIDINRDCNSLPMPNRSVCYQYQEYDDCSGTGYCSFLWRDNHGRDLQVNTYGIDHMVTGWRYRE
jgi:hypothetical protein